MKINKREINVFLFCVFFQNFAIYYNENFGIAALTAFLIYIVIKKRYYERLDKNFILFCIFFLFVSLLSSIINKKINFILILRTFMILFDVFVCYKYMKDIFTYRKEYFFKMFRIIFCVILINGIYQLIASYNQFPVILNIFNNNTSYGAKTIYELYGGWNDSFRIYSTSFEPSMHCLIVDFAFFFLIVFDQKRKSKFNIMIYILSFVNILLTFSRSGWIIFFIFIFSFLLYKLLYNRFKRTYIIIMILMPIICLISMYYLGQILFSDLSSNSRTYSAIYYLNLAKDNVTTIMIGRSVGALQQDYKLNYEIVSKNPFIEPYAHNGYIEIMYQLGAPFLIVFLIFIVKFIERGKIKKYNWLSYAAFVSLFCFSKAYAVESASILVTIIIFYSGYNENKIKEREENDINNLSE